MIASSYNKISLIWKSRNRINILHITRKCHPISLKDKSWTLCILSNTLVSTYPMISAGTKILHITRKCHPYAHVYKLKGQVLDPLHSVKYLGVYLSHDLHWNKHIKTISNQANKTLDFLKLNLIHCPPRTKETAYKVPVRPTLEYCPSVWDPRTTKNKHGWDGLKESCTLGSKSLHRKDTVTKMLSTLKWKTLKSRRTIAHLSMLLKLWHRLVSHKDASLQSAGHLYSTRSKEYSYTRPTAIRDYLIFLLPKDNYRLEQTPMGYSIVQFASFF